MIETLYDRALIVPRALRIVLASRGSTVGTGAVFLLLAISYAMILPATYTGGAIGLVSLRFLTFGTFVLALLMALLLALTVALGVYGLRHGAGAKPAGSALGAVLAALPPLLCCSPILPLAISAVAATLPAAGPLGVPIQGFIATHELEIYGVAIALMAWGLYANARRVLLCSYRSVAAAAKTQRGDGQACCDDEAKMTVREWR